MSRHPQRQHIAAASLTLAVPKCQSAASTQLLEVPLQGEAESRNTALSKLATAEAS